MIESIVWSPRLGAHVETARQRAGLRRDELAAQIGVSEETVRLWEHGSVQPSPDRLARLIVVLALDASQWSARDHSGLELPPLARRLKQERNQRAITQAEAGLILDVPQPTYAGWETGRSTPGTPFFSTLAMFLGISVSDVAALCATPFAVDTRRWPALGQLIGARRAELRLTRAALAEAMETAASTIVAWELGYRVPRPQQLRRLSKVLKIDTDSLVAAIPSRESPRTTLGELILTRQRELGLRLADVAERAGTTETTISRWVNGRNRPATESLERLAGALEVPLAAVAKAAEEAA